LKDFYRILEVKPGATLHNIKQAYRKLAHQYHPDKNESPFAPARFQELHEAYNVLTHPDRRRKYDEERWLMGMDNRVNDQRIVTADWILHEAIKLHNHLAKVDTYRMSHNALHDYVQLLLSDAHMAILHQHADTVLNRKIIKEILASTTGLRSPYVHYVAARLAQLAVGDSEALQTIYAMQGQRVKAEQRGNTLPYMVIAITILLCLMMYLYGRW
jgi:hypothetical protein